MKKYQFKLERLARVRTVQEEFARAKWQAAEQVVRIAEAREREIELSIERSNDELGRAQALPHINPGHILQARQAMEFLERQLAAQKDNTKLARIEANKLKAPWQVVRTEVEGLKRLDQKARDTHRIEREREEAKQSDEVAMDRARRNNFPLTEESR